MNRSALSAVLAVFFVISAIPAAHAFHSGGVAECEGCHTMHNSHEGTSMMTNGNPLYQAGPYLLRGSDASSACLSCHQKAGDTGPNRYHVSTADVDMPAGTPPKQLSPGGDFGWLKKTYTWDVRGPQLSKGERRGHNVIAADFGYVQDSTFIVAPGGDMFNYPADKLSCISCHDPHGKYRVTAAGVQVKTGKPIKESGSYGATPTATFAVGTYRILAGTGYQPKSLGGDGGPFSFAAPYAVAPTDYNRSEESTDTRVSYGKGNSLWCANCHGLMHSTFGSIVHPADQQLGPYISQIYNAYKKSGDITGDGSNAYLSLIPFQMDNTTDVAALKTATTSTAGPISTDRVMCLSCHRAHASGFESMLRFGYKNEFMTVADASGNPIWPDQAANPAQAQGMTTAEIQQAYYGRPATKFAPFQRVLCNKCHAKD